MGDLSLYNAQLNGKGNATKMNIKPDNKVFLEPPEDEYEIPVDEILRIIWRRLWVIVLVAFICTVSAVGLSYLQTPMYEASIKVLVGQEQARAGSVSLGSDVQGLQQLTQTVAEVLPTRPVAEGVIQRLDLRTTPESFLENTRVEQVTETQVVEVSYSDADPERAQRVANTIGTVFSEQVSEVSPSANAITATVWERAAVPDSPVSPEPVRNGLIALLLGGMLGLGLAFLLERLDDRWRSPEEVEQVSGLPTFGVVRAFEILEVEDKTKEGKAKKGES